MTDCAHPDVVGGRCLDCGAEVLPRRRTSWTARDLLAAELPASRYAVTDLFPEGLTFMAGSPKLGKSWMALGLAIAVASGGYALGQIQVERGSVLYLALEDNARRLQDRLRLLLNGEPPPDGLHIELEWPRLDEGGAEKLAEWLRDHPETRLVVIDVYPRIRSLVSSARDRFQADYDAAAELQGIAIASGVAIVALFHTRKAEAVDFVETVQGTFGTAAAADTVVVVKRSRHEPTATLHITGRDVQEQELALSFSGSVGAWVLLGPAAEHDLHETRKTILDAVRDHGKLTPKQVSELTQIRYDLAKTTMWRMAKDGQLLASGGSYIPSVTPVTHPEDLGWLSHDEGLQPESQAVTHQPDPVTELPGLQGDREGGVALARGDLVTCRHQHPGRETTVESVTAGFVFLRCGCRFPAREEALDA